MALVADTETLCRAALAARVAARADESRHQGEYSKVIEGANGTLDAVVGPLNVAAAYVDRISKGDIPPRISDMYAGDFNEIKSDLNGCTDNLTRVSSALEEMIVQQKAGDVDSCYDVLSLDGAYTRRAVKIQ